MVVARTYDVGRSEVFEAGYQDLLPDLVGAVLHEMIFGVIHVVVVGGRLDIPYR